jgi:hypothetical protein
VTRGASRLVNLKTQQGANMVTTSLRSVWRVLFFVGLISISGCVCMGGDKFLDRSVRSRPDQHEIGGGMCGGGMMTHGAASNQPTRANEKDINEVRNSHGLH